MKHLFTFLLGLLVLAARAQSGPPVEPGRLLVKLKPGAGSGGELAKVAPALQALGATGLTQKFPRTLPPNPEQPGSVDLRLIYEVTVPAGVTVAQARAGLLATGAVEYVEPRYRRFPLTVQPNDPLADSTASPTQYHLKLTRAYRAWDFTQGDTSVVIGITDTGMRLTHEDLVRQVKYNRADPVNGLDDDGDGYVDNYRGWDTSNNNNDPNPDGAERHGSQVAGIADAQTNNGKGGAGTAFKCRFLPVQVFANNGTGAFAGYEGIVYAADHGCKVINMSWGGEGYYSRFEQDVCAYAAVNRDAVLVAAAGNSGGTALYYPASYDYVLAVAATDEADVKAPYGTYNYRVDLSAPGSNIRSVFGNNAATQGAGPVDADYWFGSGSSFASPQVAAAAALIRARFPALTAAQVQAQLRRSANPALYALAGNASFGGQLGTGRLDVARAVAAVTEREARVVGSTFAPARSTGYASGETVQLAATVRNLLLPVTNLTVTLTSTSPYLTVQRGTFAVGSLPTLGQADNAALPFLLTVTGTPPPNTTVLLRYRLTADNGYQTDQFVEVRLNPDFAQLDAGDLYLSLTSRGNFGYDNAYGTGGTGVGYKQQAQLLSEGGLLLAVSPTRVSDRLRSYAGASREAFYTLAAITRRVPGPLADQEARSTFRDSLPNPQRPRSVGVWVRQRGQSWGSPAARRNVVLLDYSLRNLTADTLKGLYAGLFADWDLPGESGRNLARFDSVRRFGYCYDPLSPRVYAGVQLLSAQPAGAYSISNGAAAGAPIVFADGFSPAEKYLALSGGSTRATWSAGPADVSQVVSARVARLAPGDSVTVAFAVLGGGSLAELQAAATTAQTIYQQILASQPAAAAGAWQVYPNPAADRVQVELPAGFGPATVEVFDATGRLARRAALPAPGGAVPLVGLAPGLYLLRARGSAGQLARQVQVLGQ